VQLQDSNNKLPHQNLFEGENNMFTDLLACPNCGEPLSNGELCNLTCRREFAEKQQASASFIEPKRIDAPHPGVKIIESLAVHQGVGANLTERIAIQEVAVKNQVDRFLVDLAEASQVNL
jgi:hypothetical protein